MEVRNRFKGLDLIDRVPDELWNEVRDTVQVAAGLNNYHYIFLKSNSLREFAHREL